MTASALAPLHPPDQVHPSLSEHAASLARRLRVAALTSRLICALATTSSVASSKRRNAKNASWRTRSPTSRTRSCVSCHGFPLGRHWAAKSGHAGIGADNSVELTTNVDKIKEDYDTLRRERDALQAVVRALQFPTGVNPYAQNGLGAAAMRSSSTAVPAQHNPWGAIGSTRGSSSGPGTPIETLADSPSAQQRYFSYPSTGSGGLHPANAVATTRMSYASALNPAAPAYGTAIRLGQNGNSAPLNNTHISNADEDEEMRHQSELFRQLGSGF